MRLGSLKARCARSFKALFRLYCGPFKALLRLF